MDQYRERQIEMEQENIQRWKQSGARFWFNQSVHVYPLDPTASTWDGTIFDVIRVRLPECLERLLHAEYGFAYEVRKDESGQTGIFQEVQLCLKTEYLSQDTTRYAAWKAFSREMYPQYYPYTKEAV